jgi:acetoin utilization protein AcuB
MLTSHLIHVDHDPVYSDQSPMRALSWSALHGESRVPVVDRLSRALVGTIREEILLNHVKDDILPLQALETSLMAYPEQHVFDVWHSINGTGQHVIPVAERNGNYLGFIRMEDVRQAVEQALGLMQEGLTIFIESDHRTPDLQSIIGIIEKEGVRILSMGVEYADEDDEETLHKISMRLDPTNADRAVSSLRRFGYAVHSDSRSHDDAEWADRANELIRFLEL